MLRDILRAEGPFDLVRAEAVTLCERALREVWKEL